MLLAATLAATVSFASDIDRRAEQVNKNFVKEAAPAAARATAQKLSCSAPATLPSSPPAGAVSVAFTASWVAGKDGFTATLWREPCPGNTSQTIPYMRITPTQGVPFICSSATIAVVNSAQYDVRLAKATSSSSFCGDLYVATTFIIDQWSFDPQFDHNQKLRIIYEGVSDRFEATLPAYTPPGIPSVVRFLAQVPVTKWPAAHGVYAAIVVGDWELAKQRYDANPQDVADAMGAIAYWYQQYLP